MPDSSALRFVLFDLDGVLADSREPITRCVNLALANQGLEPEPVERLVPWIGPSLHDLFEALLAARGAAGVAIPDLVEAYRDHYETVCLETRLFPGAARAVRALAGRFRLAVATSKPAHYAQPILEANGVADAFAHIVGPPLVATHKESKTATVGRALALLGAAAPGSGPPVAAMVGDRRMDMEAACAHGLLPVGALWGFGSADELERAGAQLLLASPAEIPEVLRGRSSRYSR